MLKSYDIQAVVHCLDLSHRGASQKLFEAVQEQEIAILFNTSFASTTARNSGSAVKKEKHRTTSVEQLAAKALKGMRKGKDWVIPGWQNKAMALASRWLPENLIMNVLRRTQEQIRK